MQNVLDSMRTNVTNLQGDQTKTQARIDRLRSSYLAKYAALDAKLVQMRQQSSSVQASLAGIRA
jgi:flagellar capping protein FliD